MGGSSTCQLMYLASFVRIVMQARVFGTNVGHVHTGWNKKYDEWVEETGVVRPAPELVASNAAKTGGVRRVGASSAVRPQIDALRRDWPQGCVV